MESGACCSRPGNCSSRSWRWPGIAPTNTRRRPWMRFLSPLHSSDLTRPSPPGAARPDRPARGGGRPGPGLVGVQRRPEGHGSTRPSSVAVVLAAGRSERLQSVTGGGSKALIRLGGLAIVQRTVLNLLSYGLERVVVVTGYHAGPIGAVVG